MLFSSKLVLVHHLLILHIVKVVADSYISWEKPIRRNDYKETAPEIEQEPVVLAPMSSACSSLSMKNFLTKE